MSQYVRQRDEWRTKATEEEKRKEGKKEPEDGPKQIFNCVYLCVFHFSI